MMPSIKNLTYLLAVKQHLHFSKAASACFVSQSTLSAGISKLENDLNIQLIERTNKTVLVTLAGQKVAKQAEKIMQSMQNLVKTAQLDFAHSQIKIGIIPTISAYLLPTFIPAIRQFYPDLKMQIIEDTSDNLRLKVAQFELDFAIFAFPFQAFDKIIQRRIFADELLLVKHRDWQRKTIGNGDLLLLEQGHCLRTHILERAHIHPAQIAEISCGNLATLVVMINLKMGVSFLPKMAIEQGILKPYPDLIIEQNQPLFSRNIRIIYRQEHPWEIDILGLAKVLKSCF
jgi:LysR family hydrogen peroxide-inducible transcriptional activator